MFAVACIPVIMNTINILKISIHKILALGALLKLDKTSYGTFSYVYEYVDHNIQPWGMTNIPHM